MLRVKEGMKITTKNPSPFKKDGGYYIVGQELMSVDGVKFYVLTDKEGRRIKTITDTNYWVEVKRQNAT